MFSGINQFELGPKDEEELPLKNESKGDRTFEKEEQKQKGKEASWCQSNSGIFVMRKYRLKQRAHCRLEGWVKPGHRRPWVLCVVTFCLWQVAIKGGTGWTPILFSLIWLLFKQKASNPLTLHPLGYIFSSVPTMSIVWISSRYQCTTWNGDPKSELNILVISWQNQSIDKFVFFFCTL